MSREDRWGERYRELFDSLGQGFCLIEVLFDDAGRAVDYRFLDVNRSFEQESGMSSVVGKCVLELLPDLEPRWIETYGRVVETGRPTRFIDRVGPLEDHWFEVSAFPFGPPAEHQVAILFRNVTEKRRIEEELEATRSRLASTLSAAEIGTWEIDAARERVWADDNVRSLFDMPRDGDDLPFDVATRTLHEDDREQLRRTLDRAVQTGEDYEVACRVLVDEEQWRHALIRGRVVRDDEGRPLALPGAVIDVTEQKRAQDRIREQSEALAEAGRRKDEFLAMLSHELRNPLAPVFNALELIDHGGDLTRPQRTALGIIDRQVRHLARLVDDLLEVSRITTGRIHLQPERLSARDLVERTLERVRPVIRQRRQDLTVRVEDPDLSLWADSTRLEQAVGNLLHNASKYSEAGGAISLTVRGAEGCAEIRVRDEGVGIAPELLPHVFDLFTQADQSLDRSEGGLGIGLALVRRLTELHGGSVEAHSDGVGRGSEFVLRLPLGEPDAMTSEGFATPAATVDCTSANGSVRVLVVDDHWVKPIRPGRLQELLAEMGKPAVGE